MKVFFKEMKYISEPHQSNKYELSTIVIWLGSEKNNENFYQKKKDKV